MKHNKIFTLLVVILGLAACSDSEEEPTNKDLLTQNWQLIGVVINDTSSSNLNYSFSFQANNNYSFSTNDQNLNSISANGQWSFNSNESKILLNNGVLELDIIELTSTDMTLEYAYENFKDSMVTYRFIFER